MKIILSIISASGCLLLTACATTPAGPLPSTHPASPLGEESRPATPYSLAPDAPTQATGRLLNADNTPSHE